MDEGGGPFGVLIIMVIECRGSTLGSPSLGKLNVEDLRVLAFGKQMVGLWKIFFEELYMQYYGVCGDRSKERAA